MENHTTLAQDAVVHLTKVAPPLAVTGLSVFGLPLNEWVYIVTIAYTVLQMGYFIYKLIKKQKD